MLRLRFVGLMMRHLASSCYVFSEHLRDRRHLWRLPGRLPRLAVRSPQGPPHPHHPRHLRLDPHRRLPGTLIVGRTGFFCTNINSQRSLSARELSINEQLSELQVQNAPFLVGLKAMNSFRFQHDEFICQTLCKHIAYIVVWKISHCQGSEFWKFTLPVVKTGKMW